MLRLFWNSYTRNIILFLLEYLPIKKRRVMCICWGGKSYSCNPKAITDKILQMQKNGELLHKYDICYAFLEPDKFLDEIPKEVKAVCIGSLEYFIILATSHFLISNTRFAGIYWPFKKKKGQYYIQTMHGGHGLKRQELEVADKLSPDYIKCLYEDASRTDLMISDSVFWTKLARSIFSYPKGDILEIGLPRNDIFFKSTEYKEYIRRGIMDELSISEKTPHEIKFLIYCPTFRANGRRDVYGFDVDSLIDALESRFGGIWYILVSSHPNMLDFYKEIYDFSHKRMVDVGEYKDLQSLLVVSDVAITDYSSAGFEFALSNKPVFLLAKDLSEYERGLYFDVRELPFPFASDDRELFSNILNFDYFVYESRLSRFNKDIIGLKETGNASKAVVEWILARN